MKALTNVQAAILAISEEGGAQRYVDLEDTAIAAHRIAREQFRWEKYPEQVNLYRVRYAIKDAQGQGLLRGSVKRGWQLTPQGLELVKELRSEATREPARLTHQNVQRRSAETARIEQLPAFSAYQSGVTPSRREAAAVFRLDDYTNEQRRQEAIDRALMLFDGHPHEPFVKAMAAIILPQRDNDA